jgi:hypothetical protein
MSSLENFVEDIQYAYAYVLIKMVSYWLHDEDGANNYCSTGVEHIKTLNKNVIVKYTPVENDNPDWIDDAIITIEASPESKRILTKNLFNRLSSKLCFIEDKFIESVNGTIKKAGVWVEDLNSGTTFEGILHLNKPIYWEDNKIVIDYRVIDFTYARTHYWYPKELVEWFYESPSHIRKKALKVEKIRNEYKDEIEKLKKSDDEKSKQELQSMEYHIEYLIERSAYKFGFPATYIGNDEEMDTWKRDYENSIEPITLKEAFP